MTKHVYTATQVARKDCGRVREERYFYRVTLETRTRRIVTGQSSAHVVRIRRTDGSSYIEKTGPAPEMATETAVLQWCAGRLPVPQTIQEGVGLFLMTDLPGVNLTEVPIEQAVAAIVEALQLIHAISIEECPFPADWALRLQQAEQRLQAGLVDESDFDEINRGRSAEEILRELYTLPPLPDLQCVTHGDACLENFLAQKGQLSGMVDWGRAGITHPAQDWALALRSMRDHCGVEGEQLLRPYVPPNCAEEELLRRFRLLDELF
jgi:aminoglycoside 3'-phosphotransferase-2